jgi:hypothetical protein
MDSFIGWPSSGRLVSIHFAQMEPISSGGRILAARSLALIPAVGGLIWFAAVVFGLGALAVTIWRARSSSPAAPAPA